MALRPEIPYREIASSALSCIDSLLSKWLPGGKHTGTGKNEYLVNSPLRSDKHPSFSVNITNGKWSDFGTEDRGKDLISLYAYLQGIEQWESAIEVADLIGFKLPEGCRPANKPESERKQPIVDPATVKPKQVKEEVWHPILPIPPNAIEPPKAHERRGLPERIWAYRDENGYVLSYLYRFKKSDGGKETIPLTWAKNSKTGAEEWRWMQMPTPRPLYGLDRLAARPHAWVLLVSGEKCADAPVDLLPNAVIVTWPGGDNGIEKVDFSPLLGRNIYGWADCDAQREKITEEQAKAGELGALLPEEKQSGMKAMLKIRAKLRELNPQQKFKIVDIPAPGEKEGGWDIADAIDEGMDGKALLEFIGRTRPDDSAQPEAENNHDEANAKSASASHEEKSTADDDEAEDDTWRIKLVFVKGALVDCRENVFQFLVGHPELQGMLGHDTFANSMVKRKPAPWDKHWEEGAEWSDNDNLELSLWLQQRESFLIRGIDTINNAAKLAASRNSFNPVVDYLESIKWDQIDRVDHWLEQYVGVKSTPYSRMVGRMFLISMIARVYKPGCIMRAMPVFEGQQFRGKSSIFRILGGRWFSDSPLDLKGKDGFINIQGVWLNEIAELGSFNNSDATVIKAYISSAEDRFRSPFDKYSKWYKRQTVLVGTTNEDEYLKDKTGNTRFWPIRTEEVGNIDLDGLTAIRDQLFAEAVHLYKAGERWHPTSEEQAQYFEPEQTMRETEDPWETIIRGYLSLSMFDSTTVADVLRDCLKVEAAKMTPFMASQVGKIMTRIGWKQGRPATKPGEKRARHYMRPAAEVAPVSSTSTDTDIEDDSIPY